MSNKIKIVDFRKNRQKTKGWAPEKKFTEFGRVRVPKLLRAMKAVKNLSTPYNSETKVGYRWTQDQRRKLIKDIKKGWSELIKAWENSEEKLKKQENSNKNNYWDDE